jgi:putative ABC transport system substrate-binding protein
MSLGTHIVNFLRQRQRGSVWLAKAGIVPMLRYAVAVASALASCLGAQAQAPAPHVGVILQGGAWYAMVEGLRAGLKEQHLEEGKHFALKIRDTGGDLRAVEVAARTFEQEKVALIFTAATSVSVAAKRATANTPLVFAAGTDPVAVGLVESVRSPEGRTTGVHFSAGDVTGKRLELLKEMVPGLARVVTFYNPQNPSAIESSKVGREAARLLKIEFFERHVFTPEELQAALEALKPGEADAYVAVADALVDSHAHLIIETARAKRLPTMFYEEIIAARGGLASYGVSFPEVGRLAGKYVGRILRGTQPGDLPVERMTALTFVVNLTTSQQIGLSIPVTVLSRADRLVD